MSISLMLNGRTTTPSADDVVKNKIACVLGGTTYWTSQENSNTNNAYYVQANGTVNNNNKTNQYAIRAAAAYSSKEKEGWVDAFADCVRKKRSAAQCGEYRTGDYELDLWLVMYEVHERIYQPQASTCFVVVWPRPREIFAAAFRDRIVQHWVSLRIEPLIEQRFIETGDVSFNCRKDYGTLAAVTRLHGYISEMTCNGTAEAWIGRYDIQSFFMNIRKSKLLERVLLFVRERYTGDDIDTLVYLLRIIILHCPQKNCVRRSPTHMWNVIPPHKSLFNKDDDIGMPIGNITSQQLANFFLSFFDKDAMEICKDTDSRYIRFVDDFVIISRSKDIVKMFGKMAKERLAVEHGLMLHPDKVYIQRAIHSTRFVGTVLCHGCRYTSNRMVGSLTSLSHKTNAVCRRLLTEGRTVRMARKLERCVAGLNSYFGFMIHTQSYAIRRRIFSEQPFFWKVCYVEGNFSIVRIKNKYSVKEILLDYETRRFRAETRACC